MCQHQRSLMLPGVCFVWPKSISAIEPSGLAAVVQVALRSRAAACSKQFVASSLGGSYCCTSEQRKSMCSCCLLFSQWGRLMKILPGCGSAWKKPSSNTMTPNASVRAESSFRPKTSQGTSVNRGSQSHTLQDDRPLMQ